MCVCVCVCVGRSTSSLWSSRCGDTTLWRSGRYLSRLRISPATANTVSIVLCYSILISSSAGCNLPGAAHLALSFDIFRVVYSIFPFQARAAFSTCRLWVFKEVHLTVYSFLKTIVEAVHWLHANGWQLAEKRTVVWYYNDNDSWPASNCDLRLSDPRLCVRRMTVKLQWCLLAFWKSLWSVIYSDVPPMTIDPADKVSLHMAGDGRCEESFQQHG